MLQFSITSNKKISQTLNFLRGILFLFSDILCKSELVYKMLMKSLNLSVISRDLNLEIVGCAAGNETFTNAFIITSFLTFEYLI